MNRLLYAAGRIRTCDHRLNRAELTENSENRVNLWKYYQENLKIFEKWLLSRIDERTARTYINYLNKYLEDVKSVKDMQELLLRIEKGKNWFIKAIRNLLNFAEEREDLDIEFIAKLRKILKIKETGVREIYINDEELIEAYSNIRDEFKQIFKLLVFSGIRLTHAFQMLKSFNPSNLKFNGNIARYPISFASKGKKKGYWCYMPKEFAKELEDIKLYENYWTYVKGLEYKRVNANTIRKWNYNFLILNGVPESVADFIQGRASITVGSMHYLAKVKQADEWYSRVVDKLVKLFNFS